MLRGSSKYQERVLTTIGAVGLLCIAVAVSVAAANPFGGRPKNQLSIAIITPYVGQGIEAGTAVVLHGIKVGEITNVNNTANGAVRLDTDLQTQPVRGITDKVDIDFRPINYFGVPGINLLPNPGGHELRDGSQITVAPKGNFTLSQLLAQLGDVSAASLTPQLVNVIDRVTRYTDGLNPAFETAVTVTRTIDAAQTVPTEQLLANLAPAIAAFPSFTDASLVTGRRIIDFSYYPGQNLQSAASSGPRLQFPFLQAVKAENLADETEPFFRNVAYHTTDLLANGLFASVGKLVSSHVDDLYPLIAGLKSITDTGPVLLRPADVAQKLADLRSRFETLYAGDGHQHAISVRILLDSLPGVAAPLGVVAGDPQ
ncbi:MAG: mammalian cell entry protein [Mycobacterium sp.]